MNFSFDSLAQAEALKFVRFVICGGLAALVNFGSRILYSKVASFEIAIVLAYFTAALSGYFLFKIFVFEDRFKTSVNRTIVFLIVSLLGLAQTYLVSIFLVKVIWPWAAFSGPPYATAHAIGICVPTITSYIGHRWVTFGKALRDN